MSIRQMAVIILNAEYDSLKPDQFEVGPRLEALVQQDKLTSCPFVK